MRIVVNMWIDEYSFFNGIAEASPTSDGMRFELAEKAEMRYLDCWDWFWEAIR